GATHDLSCYSRDGCIVDFSRMPLDVAWGRATLNPTAVGGSKGITEPVHRGANQRQFRVANFGLRITGSKSRVFQSAIRNPKSAINPCLHQSLSPLISYYSR